MVSSYYPVFAGKNVDAVVKFLEDNFQLKVAHHFSQPFIEYYVLKDACGNHVDVMRHEEVEMRGLFGMRVNVDDFDAMVDFLKNDQGYEFSFGPFENDSVKFAVMENPSKPDAMRYIVSHHKKHG